MSMRMIIISLFIANNVRVLSHCCKEELVSDDCVADEFEVSHPPLDVALNVQLLGIPVRVQYRDI